MTNVIRQRPRRARTGSRPTRRAASPTPACSVHSCARAASVLPTWEDLRRHIHIDRWNIRLTERNPVAACFRMTNYWKPFVFTRSMLKQKHYIRMCFNVFYSHTHTSQPTHRPIRPKGREGGRFRDMLVFILFFEIIICYEFNSWIGDSFRDRDLGHQKVL